jgi:tetratricopeptide (TPR) repeat protein
MWHRFRSAVGALVLLAPISLAQSPREAEHVPRTPWYDGLGRYSRTITAANDGAQGYFNQGLVFLMAGNAEEASRSFEEAARFDPHCAMAFWGLAMAQGPQLGRPDLPNEQAAAAVAALNRAHELAPGARPVEQALVQALAQRHQDPAPADRRRLEGAYAEALRAVHAQYPGDPDVAAWLAEAVLLVEGGPQWPRDGRPTSATDEARRVLEQVRQDHPQHPLANRLLLLIWQASPYPERGDEMAAQLRGLAPGLGPLVHLAALHDARRGRWSEAIETGLKALAADARYLDLAGEAPERYRLTMAEHRRLVVQAAMMSGRSALALEQARALVASVPPGWRQQHAVEADGLDVVPLQVLVRFGRWDEILAEPTPPAEQPLARAFHRTARGLAQLERRDLAAAREEWEALRPLIAEIPADAVWRGRPVRDVAGVAASLLESRLRLAAGDPDAAVAGLEAAVRHEDTWRRDLFLPVLLPARHALGALQLQRGKVDEAIEVYRKDLEIGPENGWALYGLMQALQRKGETEEAAAVESRWSEVWKAADAPVPSWGPESGPMAPSSTPELDRAS